LSTSSTETFDENGVLYEIPTNMLYMLNEKLEITTGNNTKKYVVVPINYKEYDR
jgi:hypothetical protein